MLLGLCVLTWHPSPAQTNNQEQYRLHIVRASSPIVVDGLLDEAAWQEAEVATDFWQKWPKVQPHGEPRTEVRATYDDHFLYFGFVCYDTSYYVIQTLKRDVNVWDSDGVGVLLDPVNERTNGYYFHV
ncbi:MAG: hydrolase, partial [Bacteroidetes bacterium]